jgi:coenzyme PQQ synthesis protein D (PqqD)
MAAKAVAITDELRRQSVTLASRVTVPSYVVYRAFARETVVLNLRTGRYHGLNPSGGRILDLLQREPTVGAAAERLGELYAVPTEQATHDLCAFCQDLADRGLIEISADGLA